MTPPSLKSGGIGGAPYPFERGGLFDGASPSTRPSNGSGSSTTSPPISSSSGVGLSGQRVLLVGNPQARDGEIAKELSQVQTTLERAGAKVTFLETHPEESTRREQIKLAVEQLLRKPGHLFVLPWGGDGTIGEAENGFFKAAGIDLRSDQASPEALEKLQSRMTLVLPQRGTYSDRAVIAGGPTKVHQLVDHLKKGFRVPYRPAIIEFSNRPFSPESIRRSSVQNLPEISYEIAGHSFGMGIGGYLFALREQSKKSNPEIPLSEFLIRPYDFMLGKLSKGRISYLRMFLSALSSRYLFGVDMEMNYFDSSEGTVRNISKQGTEIMVAPNRIIAGYGGVPSAWGETRLMALPPGPQALIGLLEIVGRGNLAKYLGIDSVGPKSKIRSLPQDNQILVQPGDRMDVQLKVPNTVLWDTVRLTDKGMRALGITDSSEWVPAAGEPLKVPSIKDGDVIRPTSRFTVRVPEYSATQLVHPDSMAVRLIRSSALAHGVSPLIGDRELTSRLDPYWQPGIFNSRGGGIRIQTNLLSQERLAHLMGRYQIPHEKMIDLLAASQRVVSSGELRGLASPNLDIERVGEFLESNQGEEWLKKNINPWRAFRHRVLQGGVPLATGVGAMIGAEWLSDQLGLDPVRDQQLRFALAVYGIHAVQANVTPLWEVAANRLLHKPYDQVRVRNSRLARETFSQWTLRYHPNWSGALAASWRSGALAVDPRTTGSLTMEGRHLSLGLWNSLPGRISRYGMIPVRAAWNMGTGLFFSRVAESWVSDMSPESSVRQILPTAAFFTPDVLQIIAPRSSALLFRNRFSQAGARLFAAGFMGDMAYTGLHRYILGNRSSEEIMFNFQGAQLRDEVGELSSWHPGSWIGIFAPSLGAHLVSHEYGFGKENLWRREAKVRSSQMADNLSSSLRRQIPWMAKVLNQSPSEIFKKKIELTWVEKMMLESLQRVHLKGPENERMGMDDLCKKIMEEYSGHHLTLEQTRRHLARIQGKQIQDNIGALHNMETSQAQDLKVLFNNQGILRNKHAADFSSWIGSHRDAPFYFMSA